MYDVTIPIYDEDLNLKNFFNHADAYDSIIVHFNYDPKRSATEFSTSTLEKYIQEIKRLCPDKEITYNVTYSLNEEYVVDTSECKQLEEVDNYLRDNFNTELFLNNLGEKSFYNFGFRKTLSANRKLDEVAEKIKNATYDGKELSVFEKFIMAYEYVTQFVYKEEAQTYNNSKAGESRHWINVIEGDKIVCAGYTSLLQALCDRIFTENELIVFQQDVRILPKNGNTKVGYHETALVYMKDDKYSIDGLLYADPTADSCKSVFACTPSSCAFCCLPILDILNAKDYLYDFNNSYSDHSIMTNIYLLNNSEEYCDFLVNKCGYNVDEGLLINRFQDYYLMQCYFRRVLPGLTINNDYGFFKNFAFDKFIETINEKANTIVPLEAFVNSYKIIGNSKGLKGKKLQDYIKLKIDVTKQVMKNYFNIEKCNNCFAKEIVMQRKKNKI